MPRDLSDDLSGHLSELPQQPPGGPVGAPVGSPVGPPLGPAVALPFGRPGTKLTSPDPTSPTSRTSGSHQTRTREALEPFALLELTTSSRSPLASAPASSAAEPSAAGGRSSDTTSQTPPRLPWKSPPIGQEKTDMS